MSRRKRIPAFRQQVEHHVEVFELFVYDLRHFAAELNVFDVREDQIERGTGRLLLAVSVVDQDRGQVTVDLGEPTWRCIALEVEHGVGKVSGLGCQGVS